MVKGSKNENGRVDSHFYSNTDNPITCTCCSQNKLVHVILMVQLSTCIYSMHLIRLAQTTDISK